MAKIRGLYLRGDIYWFSHQVAGTRSHTSLRTKELTEAIDRLNEIRTNPSTGCGETIAAMIDSFVASKVKENKFTDPTKRSAIVSLNSLAAYCTRLPVEGVTTAHIQGWFNKMKETVTESTAQTHLNRARSFFRWAKAKGITRYNPCEKVSIGRPAKHGIKRFCTELERDKLIARAPKNSALQFILYCGFYAGLRKNEIIEARYDWFDLKGKLLHVRKTDTFTPKDREERSIPIAPNFLKFLKGFKRGRPYAIEPNVTKGDSIYRWDFRRPFTEHITRCKQNWVTTHTMRHTFASLLASGGVSIYKIAIWMGDDVRTVQKHYAKLVPGDSDIDALN